MTNESGRSMVEMLGVLAVMGVLSVAGIAAFNRAMDKNKANTLINEAQKRAVIVAGQIGFNGREPSLAEFLPYNTTSAGTFGGVITTGLTGQFGIKVSGVKKSICENILNTIGNTTSIRRLSTADAPTTAITTCNDINTFLMVYNNDMTTNTAAGEFSDKTSCINAGFVYKNGQCANDMCATCTTSQDCLTIDGEKKCVSACPSGQTRDDETGTCANNKCTDYTNCGEGQFCDFDCAISQPSSGACKEISKQTETTGKYISSTGGMSFWSAVDFCKANGMHSITTPDICEVDPTNPNCFQCTANNITDEIISKGFTNTYWGATVDTGDSNRRMRIFPSSGSFSICTASLTDWACKNYYALCIE